MEVVPRKRISPGTRRLSRRAIAPVVLLVPPFGAERAPVAHAGAAGGLQTRSPGDSSRVGEALPAAVCR
jgi:hypothetical protein